MRNVFLFQLSLGVLFLTACDPVSRYCDKLDECNIRVEGQNVDDCIDEQDQAAEAFEEECGVDTRRSYESLLGCTASQTCDELGGGSETNACSEETEGFFGEVIACQ